MSVLLLPEEVWMEVFKYLSKSDKMNVRSCCRCFKRLVDHRSLWKDENIVLRKVRFYKPSFWKVLRSRMLTTVFVDDANEKEWQTIVTSLPLIRSVTVQLLRVNTDVLTILSSLKDLKTLVIRILCPNPSDLTKSLALLPQLEHLSVCFQKVDPARSGTMRAISQLCNLTSLRYHESTALFHIPKETIHAVLRSLPKLKHLSLRISYPFKSMTKDYFSYSGNALDSPGESENGKLLDFFSLLKKV